MKVKTAKATGLQLDWGVGKVLQVEKLQLLENGVIYKPLNGGRQLLRHNDPAVCMGLIDTERLRLVPSRMGKEEWICDKVRDKAKGGIISGYGSTPAEAVARCVIAMKLGEYFECPDELGVTG